MHGTTNIKFIEYNTVVVGRMVRGEDAWAVCVFISYVKRFQEPCLQDKQLLTAEAGIQSQCSSGVIRGRLQLKCDGTR